MPKAIWPSGMNTTPSIPARVAYAAMLAEVLPVLAQAKVLVGSIKMELSDYEGLANPIAKED